VGCGERSGRDGGRGGRGGGGGEEEGGPVQGIMHVHKHTHAAPPSALLLTPLTIDATGMETGNEGTRCWLWR